MYLDEKKSNQKDKKLENNINNSFRNKTQILKTYTSVFFV